MIVINKESTIIYENIEDENLGEDIENNNLENTSLNTTSPSVSERKSLLITFLDSLANGKSLLHSKLI